MILYYSGTGNSEYAAKYLAEKLEDEVISLTEKIRTRDYSPMESERPWIVVTPTYAWQIPRILREYIRRTDFLGNPEMYFVMTCGQDIGKAGKYLSRLCDGLNIKYKGCAEVVMPENYIAMFTAPTKEEAIPIITKSEETLNQIAECIRAGESLPYKEYHFSDELKSGIINQVFYPLFVRADSFHVTEACISCGKCTEVCPLDNIILRDGKPEWGDRCTHCMACICRCPQEAIEYGKRTKGKVRYVCPNTL